MYKDKVTGKYLTGGVGGWEENTVALFFICNSKGTKESGVFSSDNFLFKQQQQTTSSQQFNPIPLAPRRLLTRLRCLLVACEPVMFQRSAPLTMPRENSDNPRITTSTPHPHRQFTESRQPQTSQRDTAGALGGGGRKGGIHPTQSYYRRKHWKGGWQTWPFQNKIFHYCFI